MHTSDTPRASSIHKILRFGQTRDILRKKEFFRTTAVSTRCSSLVIRSRSDCKSLKTFKGKDLRSVSLLPICCGDVPALGSILLFFAVSAREEEEALDDDDSGFDEDEDDNKG